MYQSSRCSLVHPHLMWPWETVCRPIRLIPVNILSSFLCDQDISWLDYGSPDTGFGQTEPLPVLCLGAGRDATATQATGALVVPTDSLLLPRLGSSRHLPRLSKRVYAHRARSHRHLLSSCENRIPCMNCVERSRTSFSLVCRLSPIIC